MDDLDSNGTSNTNVLNVEIKENAPKLTEEGLKTGVYEFCVSAVDVKGDRVSPSISNKIQACASLTVEKMNPNVVFQERKDDYVEEIIDSIHDVDRNILLTHCY